MNILILTSRVEVSSGWGRYTLDLANALEKDGHIVRIACAQMNEDFARLHQVPVLPPPLQFKKTHFLSCIYAGRLVRRLKKEGFRPDIVHAVVEPYAPIAISVSRSLSASAVVTCHGSFAVNLFHLPIIGSMQKRALRRAAEVICISRYTKNRLAAFLPELSPKVIHNGIDLAHFTNTAPAPREATLLLGVGALKERKGFDLVIAALPHVLRQVPDARYVIIGDQHDREYFAYLKRLVVEHGLEKQVEFLEHVSEETLQSYYKKARVFVLTPVSSLTSFEGFGLVYIEAAAYGLPAIGSYGNGGEEAVADGETGFLVHADATDDIAEKILHVLSMGESDYRTMSVHAHARAEKLSWDKVVREYLEVYKSAL